MADFRQNVLIKHRLLFPAFFAGSLADWLDFIVISSLITFSWQLPASDIATAFIIYALPKILFSGLAGSLCQRLPLYRNFAISLLVRATIMVAMAFWATDLWSLCALIFVKSTFSVLYLPAEQLTIKNLADDTAVEQLSGWLQIIHQGAKLVGPAAGGALLTITDPAGAFLVSGGLFVLAFLMLSLERKQLLTSNNPQDPSTAGKPAGASHSLLSDLREGARYAFFRYPLNLALLMVSTALLVIFLYDNFIPMLSQSLGFDAKAFGMTISLVGFGGIVGGYLSIGLCERANPIYIIPTAIALSGPMMIYFGLCAMGVVTVYTPVFLLVWFLVGVVTSLALVPFNTYLVKTTPKDKLGTVTGLNESVQTLGVIAGPILGAAVVEGFGIGAVFILGGLLSLLIAFIGFSALAIKPPHDPAAMASTRADQDSHTTNRQRLSAPVLSPS